MENLSAQRNSGLVDVTIASDQIEGTAARFSQWLIELGASVKAGDPLLELETDKVAMEVPAPADGVLVEMMAVQDQEITPELVLGRIQTDASGSASATRPQASPTESNSVSAATPEAPQQSPSNAPLKSGSEKCNLVGPAVRRLVREHNLDLDSLSGSGRADALRVMTSCIFWSCSHNHRLPRRNYLPARSFEVVKFRIPACARPLPGTW